MEPFIADSMLPVLVDFVLDLFGASLSKPHLGVVAIEISMYVRRSDGRSVNSAHRQLPALLQSATHFINHH